MPTFREFLAENNVAYSFKTFDQLKGMAQPIPVGQPDLKPKDIGDAINETVSDTLSAFGMSGTAEDLRDHVDAAVEEVQDIIDGQRKKVKFVASAAGLKKTVDKLRKRKKRRKNVLMIKKLLKSLSKLDSVVEHDKNNPAQKDIGQSILSDKEHAKHIVGNAVEALSEKKPTESWGTWLINLFKKLWGGIKSIWKFIQSNIKIIASVILIVWVVWSAYTTGNLADGVRMMSQQVVTVANTAWEACVGIFQSGYQWIMDYPVWFVKSAAGQTDQLSAGYEELALLNAVKSRKGLRMAAAGSFASVSAIISSSSIGSALTSYAVAAFGLTPMGAGALVLAAAAGVTGALTDDYVASMDASFRQDQLLEQSQMHFNILLGMIGAIWSLGVFQVMYYRCMKKRGIKEKDARKYLNKFESLARLGADLHMSNLKFKRKQNRIFMKAQQKFVEGGARLLGLEEFADAVHYEANESCLALDSKFMRWKEKTLTTGEDFEGQFEMNKIKVAEMEQKKNNKVELTQEYVKEQLETLKDEVEGGMQLTKENLKKFIDQIKKDNEAEARENLYSDELSDTPTEEMQPLRLVQTSIRLRF